MYVNSRTLAIPTNNIEADGIANGINDIESNGSNGHQKYESPKVTSFIDTVRRSFNVFFTT